ncbi:MAG: hypothetical protein ACM3X1_03885 [Ignavibacteriales bacterium]
MNGLLGMEEAPITERAKGGISQVSATAFDQDANGLRSFAGS